MSLAKLTQVVSFGAALQGRTGDDFMLVGSMRRVGGLLLVRVSSIVGVSMLGVLASCSGSDGTTKEPDAAPSSADGSVSLPVDAGANDAAASPTPSPDASNVDASGPVEPPQEAGVVPSASTSEPDAAPTPEPVDAAQPEPQPDASTLEPTEDTVTSEPPPEDAGDTPATVDPGPDLDASTDAPEPPTADDLDAATETSADACPDGGCVAEPEPEVCDGCSIDGACYADGSSNPQSSCMYCDALQSPTAWRSRANGARCNDGLFCNGVDSCMGGVCSVHAGRTCTDGVACNGLETCNEDANECQAGTPLCSEGQSCDAETGACVNDCGGCTIAGVCYTNGATPSEQPCLECNVQVSTTEWSPREGQSCSDGGEICQAGTCACPAGYVGENCNVCVVYVDLERSDANTGLSWETAVASVQRGLDMAAERAAATDDECQVWVKTGTYHPIAVDEQGTQESTIALRSLVSLYGGFSGDETALEQRSGQETILSGDHDITDDPTNPDTWLDNSSHVVTGADDALIDGFTITAGVSDGLRQEVGAGGGILAWQTSPTISNCRVVGNRASSGAGLFALASNAIVSDTVFASNTADGFGGGVFSQDGNVHLTRVTFRENNAAEQGGGLFVADDSQVSDSEFVSNRAEGNESMGLGGALAVDSASPTFENTRFEDNGATFGGAVFTEDASPTFVNCVFAENSAIDGSVALHVSSLQTDLSAEYQHCTLFGNAALDGAAVTVVVERAGNDEALVAARVASPAPAISNSIIWGNTDPPIHDESGLLQVSYTLITGDWPGEGNFHCDPQFVDEADLDLHLQASSLAIDASDPDGAADLLDVDGDADVTELLPLDYDRNSRAIDGDATPPTLADLGAYEAQTSQVQAALSGQITDVSADLPSAFCAEGGSAYWVEYQHAGTDDDVLEISSKVIAPSSVVSGVEASVLVEDSSGGVELSTSHGEGFSSLLPGRIMTTRIALSHCGDLIDERHVITTCDDDGQTLVDTEVGGSEPLEVSTGQWDWIGSDSMTCADGSNTGFGLNLVAGSKELVVFMDGGGACNSPLSCSLLGIATSFDEDAFDARMAVLSNAGIFQRGDTDNPIAGMSWAYVPYCTGDLHAGSHQADGQADLNYMGHHNFGVVIEALRRNYPTLERLIVAGGSAGGFGTLFNFDVAAGSFGEAEVQLLDDSGPLLSPPWMSENFQLGLFGTWDVQDSIPTLCSDVAPGNLEDLYGCLADLYPASRFGLVTSNRDSVNRSFLGAPGTPMSEADYEAGILALAAQLSSESQWRIFVQDSTAHVLSLTNPLSAVRVPDEPGGSTLTDFMRGVIDGGDDFASVLPE